MSAQDVTRVSAAALQFAGAQGLPLEGLNVGLTGSTPDVSLYCWEWSAEDLERWALEDAPLLAEPWEGHNFVGRRGQVQVYGVAMLLAVIVRKA